MEHVCKSNYFVDSWIEVAQALASMYVLGLLLSALAAWSEVLDTQGLETQKCHVDTR